MDRKVLRKTFAWLTGGLAAAVLLTGTARASAGAEPSRTWDTFSDTWGATDALGRSVPGFAQVGGPRHDRTVALFYFLWLGEHVNGGPYDISRILKQDPDAMSKPDSPLWGGIGVPHHWGEPLFGYYLTDDDYVLRKHAQMLSDAGVDVIVFDVTNRFTYKRYYMALLRVFSEVRATGGKTPQVAFLAPFWDPSGVVHELYRDLYGPGLYSDLWFRWEGKPLILADPDLAATGEGTDAQNVADHVLPGHTLGQTFTITKQFSSVSVRCPTFFQKGSAVTVTLRQTGPAGEKIASQRFQNVADNAWLELHLDQLADTGSYYVELSAPSGQIGWWSHSSDVYPGGQAYTDGTPVPGDRTLRIAAITGEEAKIHSFFTFRKPQADYFQGPTGPNQWSWLEVYPQHVFRSSRGEKEQMSVGVAQNAVDRRLGCLSEENARTRNWHNGANDTRPGAERLGLNFAEQAGRALKEDPRVVFITGWNEWIAGRFNEFAGVKLPVMFVDEFNQERSRDIEPMKGGHGDDYYYQMVSFIRRYKGVRKPPLAGPVKTIKIDGDFRDWASVRPEFRDDIGDESHRDHVGWNNVAHYQNNTGRNDFILMKVSRDRDYLYFYARTRKPITSDQDRHWMMLFLHTANRGPGWEGYQYVVNRVAPSHGLTVLERSLGGWRWKTAARVHYCVRGNELEMAIRRTDLGLKRGANHVQIELKWADNMQSEGDIMDFLVNGDAAPNGRFRYLYRTP